MYLATLDTRNFTFQALGTTEAEAIEALRQGWLKHASYLKHREQMYSWDFLADDVDVAAINLGECLRDGEVLT